MYGLYLEGVNDYINESYGEDVLRLTEARAEIPHLTSTPDVKVSSYCTLIRVRYLINDVSYCIWLYKHSSCGFTMLLFVIFVIILSYDWQRQLGKFWEKLMMSSRGLDG